MPNYVHFVMVPSQEDGLRAALGDAHRRYTRHINFQKGCRGHLWQERFHSFVMDEAYLLATVRYAERNPVATNPCRHPANWKWSSTFAYLRGKDDVRVRPMLNKIDDWNAYLSDVREDAETPKQNWACASSPAAESTWDTKQTRYSHYPKKISWTV